MKPCIAVVGLGSIGKRHITNLLAMDYACNNIVGFDTNGNCNEKRIPTFWMPAEMEGHSRLTHAIICTPPSSHYDAALMFLLSGVNVLVEKPLCRSWSNASYLKRYAEGEELTLAVGYMERANPTVLAAKKFAQENTVKNAYIELYWTMEPKTYQQDFLLESSHAIDTARFILGDMKVVGSTIKEKSAEITLAHAGGYTFVTIDADANPMRRINLYAHNGQSFGKQYGTELGEWDACYKAELQAFLDGKPLCTGADGLAVMEILDEVKR